MPSPAVLNSVILSASVPFTNPSATCEILQIPLSLPICVLQKRKGFKKLVHKGVKAEPVKKVSVDQLLGQLKAASFVLDDQPYSSLLKSYHREFLSQSIAKGLIDPSDFPSPVMEHLLLLPQGNESILPVTARKNGLRVVPVTASFPNLTAILDGILPVNAFISATTYICLSPLTQKVTSLFFFC